MRKAVTAVVDFDVLDEKTCDLQEADHAHRLNPPPEADAELGKNAAA